jgi:hypothetical protein
LSHRRRYAEMRDPGNWKKERTMTKESKTNDITLISEPEAKETKNDSCFHRSRCSTCGKETEPSPQPTVYEIVLNIACGVLLVVLLAAVVYGADRWIDIHIRYRPDYLLWHEPLEDWNGYSRLPGSDHGSTSALGLDCLDWRRTDWPYSVGTYDGSVASNCTSKSSNLLHL